MKNVKVSKLWDQLHSSYWFIPAVMAVGATALAFTMLTLDRTDKLKIDYWWVYTGGADGARSLLEAVAGSMVSVAATAFSITIVALQLAASNFGPRLLRNFMQDTGNQVVLGTFISTFIYCLLVLRTIHGDGDGYSEFVPQLAVTFGILLAIISIGVLIYFIHHASTIIQASHVIQNVSADFHSAIERLFPQKIGHSEPELRQTVEEIPMSFEEEALPIRANGTGYLQAIDDQELMNIACQHHLLIRLQTRPGKFVIQGSDLVLVFPGYKVNQKLTKKINNAFILGKERTEQQDVEFPINQLVEIALRAISPAVNDPFTAIRCIDQLSAGLCHLVQRNFPSPYRYDNNKLRVIAEGVKFKGLTDAAFNQIRQYGRSDAAVSIRLLEAIALIANYTNNSKYQSALRHHADMILQDSREGLSQEQDCKDVQERYYEVIKSLDHSSTIKDWD
ncbi:DUF2254 domain-containing protein [Nostocaceae cyanobacterium CENA357]|uniref:DUF2254 domain-containing protein n=1 Tax=Atlanticothrix silvestris CENA357 TaxID=1725252 RepID=A0A8J7HPT8_9CYAN|nr:DUF2254 domain-containing protein [Atlanticothrix silvestris]MBH8556090.1 DUF2254 domain-containing protein [Atlanticothrix silvestris CENA357]